MTPETVIASDRLNTSALLLFTLPGKVPVVLPAPIRKVPAEIVVPPVKEFAPESVKVPAPVLDTLAALDPSEIMPVIVESFRELINTDPEAEIPVADSEPAFIVSAPFAVTDWLNVMALLTA